MRTADPGRLQRIFDSAITLFAERRFHEVRMDDISARAGVSKGLLYQHFKDKDDLYLEIITRGLNQLLDQVRLRIAGSHDPEDKLFGFVQEVIQFFNTRPSYLELIELVKRSHSKETDAIREQFLDLLIAIIRQLEASGRWTVDDPKFAALALLGMIREHKLWQTPDSSALPKRIVHLFLHGLSKT
jgi:AcrR family transcriptional regulator